jgi:hypothetical protein
MDVYGYMSMCRWMWMDVAGWVCVWIELCKSVIDRFSYRRVTCPLGIIPLGGKTRPNIATRFLIEPSGYCMSELSDDATPEAYFNWLDRPEVIFPDYQYQCYPDIGFATTVCIRPGKLHFGPGISPTPDTTSLSSDDLQRELDHYRRLADGRLRLLRRSTESE